MALIYVSRHGEAEPYAATDAQHPLTAHGCEAVRALWQGMLEEGVRPARIISSPYLRAQQTAAIIAEVMGGLIVETEPLITPDSRVSDVFQWLAKQYTLEGVLFVSHMPLVGQWVGQDRKSTRLNSSHVS